MSKKIKYSGIFTILLLTLFILTGCSSVTNRADHYDNWNRIKQSKKVTIGLDVTFVPMGFENKSGQITGFDIDLAKAVFKQYGIKPVFQPIDWSMNVTELRNTTIDLIWNGFSITPEREKVVNFSTPYLSNDQELVSLKSSKINKFIDMKGKYLGVQSGSSGLNDINDQPNVLKKYIKNQSPILYNSFTNAFIDLNHGRISGLLIDSTYANYYIAHQPNPDSYKVVTGSFPREEFGVGIRKGDKTLKNKINVALNKLAKTGELKKICEKWFGKNYRTPLLKLINQTK
ncbi:amino acid ABC transporter substrate-binding protein [Apilactobacillus apinorum]|uniref:amino acid ABC transporter substrate-binding protein n=1 Tax=Apilactobacillus apinorum TaxID=1218495 RepID=UPI0006B5568F|nr:amino acid ABC transporter substrate-binding protein [Apilactobacillus apinorum]KOY69122.1 ABC-type amino acid transport/signal transduction system, periplasmic component/domain [Apilactobacillus apinorum]CAI2650724.1 ABC-type amino acid transport/signal transduction system, periplasmic component/domain [Apilactobacillus apinorum]